MNKEQIMLFDAKLDKLNAEDLLYFNGFKDCIQFMVNVVFKVAERSAYDMKDDVMRFPYTRLLYNMKDALEEKLVDELFRRMDHTIEGYKSEYLMKEDEEEDYDIPDPAWMSCEKDCLHCNKECSHRQIESICPEDCLNCVYICLNRKNDYIDPGKQLPDPGIDFMNIGGKKG